MFVPATIAEYMGRQVDYAERVDLGGATPVGTFTVTRQPIHRVFADETPQIQALVELTVGVRMTTTLVEIEPEMVEVGMAVRARFDDGPDGITLLRFGPA